MKPAYQGQREFKHGRMPQLGVVLVNLGTPEFPTAGAVRRYLGEFLSDPRVVEIPRLVWKIILHGIILRVRPKKSAHTVKPMVAVINYSFHFMACPKPP